VLTEFIGLIGEGRVADCRFTIADCRVKLKASLKLTNANKIIFTIFTALKKNKQLVFQVITVLSGLEKRKKQ
jgi:hypothetical protein